MRRGAEFHVYVLDISTRRVFDYLTSNCVNLICLSNNLLLLGYYSYNKKSLAFLWIRRT
jgi:hypothetical protein